MVRIKALGLAVCGAMLASGFPAFAAPAPVKIDALDLTGVDLHGGRGGEGRKARRQHCAAHRQPEGLDPDHGHLLLFCRSLDHEAGEQGNLCAAACRHDARTSGADRGSHGTPAVWPLQEADHVRTFASNEEFIAVLREMIYRWCDDRQLQPLAVLLPGYLAINGLTDGRGELHDALFSLRAFGPDAFSPADWETIQDLIRAARSLLGGR